MDRLHNIKDDKLRDTIINVTSEQGIVEYALTLKNKDDILKLSKRIYSKEGMLKLLDGIDDSFFKIKLLETNIDRYRDNIEIYDQAIPKIEDVESEIKRLDYFKNEKILKTISDRTSKEGKIRFVKKSPDKVGLLENFNDFEECLQTTDDDKTRAALILYLPTDEKHRKEFYKYIDDEFYRVKITDRELVNRDGINENEFIDKQMKAFDEFAQVKQKLSQLDNEQEKVEIITKLDDNDMKISLMKGIENRKNREKIINSLQNDVDKDIARLNQLAQEMILEFVEDSYNGKIPQEKEEKIMIEFNRNDVLYGHLKTNVNGQADHLLNKIIIREGNIGKDNLNIGFLVHEYGHRLSLSNYREYVPEILFTFEEGNADTFSDLVINHYLEKHPDVDLGFGIDKPYMALSRYDTENDWTRTMLYPLEKDGKDVEAICEWVLGDKEKYFEMTVDNEFVSNLKRDANGIICDVVLTEEELYNSHNGSYKNPNMNSIYMRRNSKIEKFATRDEKSVSVIESARNAYLNVIGIDNLRMASSSISEVKDKQIGSIQVGGR